MVVFESPQGEARVYVRLDRATVWLLLRYGEGLRHCLGTWASLRSGSLPIQPSSRRLHICATSS